MANTKSAKKRIRQTKRRTIRNRVFRSSARTHIKKTRSLIEDGNIEAAEEAAREAVSLLDRAASKGILHPRNASRRKSRIMSALAAARQKLSS
ncbi:MAG TPA: 30S ribosomal protein S20 [Anaerolineae bacterium]|nr:30S ribosomal protein S20 [Anaerolineae bacterium]